MNRKHILALVLVLAVVLTCASAFATTCSHNYKYQSHNSTTHTLKCEYCGDVVVESHTALCTGVPSACQNPACGATGVTVEIAHTFTGYDYDEDFHWMVCQDCNTVQHKAYHTVQNDSCIYCGANGLTQKVSSITLNATSKTLERGTLVNPTFQITATVKPANAANTAVTFKSSNLRVATVSATGLVTAVGTGTCQITVTAADGGGAKAVLNLTVNPMKVQSITLNKTSMTMRLMPGEEVTAQLTPTVLPEGAVNKAVTYTSTDPSVATVDSYGMVKAIAKGTCKIVVAAKDGSGKKAECAVTVVDGKVQQINLNATSKTLVLKSGTAVTFQLVPTVRPADATNTAVSYSSSNPGVASVTTTGLIQAVGVGTCNITVRAMDGSGVQAVCSVRVKKEYVTDITLNATSKIFELGAGDSITFPLTATVLPSYATDTSVRWTSSDPTIVTVYSNGVIRPLKTGYATITCSAKDGSGVSAICNVKVKPKMVTGITLNTAKYTMALVDGKDVVYRLTATVQPSNASNKNIVWTSSDPTVASVSGSGLVTAHKIGTCKITAAAADGSGKKAECAITVTSANAIGVKLNATSKIFELKAGQSNTFQLKATPVPATASYGGWNYVSSNEKVVTVNSNGLLTYKAAGTAVITVTPKNGSGSATCTVKVKSIPVTSIKLNATSKIMELKPGKKVTFQLVASALPTNAGNTGIKYTSSNTKVVTVSSKGLITAVGPGTCTVTAAAVDGSGVKAVCNVKIKGNQVTSIKLNATSKIVELKSSGTTFQLKATVAPSTAPNKQITWSSSNTAVATVDQNGLVTLKDSGVDVAYCTIKATAKDGSGVSASCTFKVKRVKVTGITLNATGKTLVISGGAPTFQLKGTVAPTNATYKALKFESTNTAVATVSSTGLVTGIAPGSCKIKVSAKDGSGVVVYCNITVK